MRFASFLSGGFTTVAVINPPERKLAKRTSVQWFGHKNDAFEKKSNFGGRFGSKVYQISKKNMVSLILPKKRMKLTILSTEGAHDSEFHFLEESRTP